MEELEGLPPAKQGRWGPEPTWVRNRIRFSIDGPGEIVATDNGDPTSFESFPSKERNAFNGLCLAIVRAKPGQTGMITLKAQSEGLTEAAVILRSEMAR